MKPSALIEFKCIGAGRHDVPPYSKDGTWRVGLLISTSEVDNKSTILYMGELFTISQAQTRQIE